jgi:hypothetical protein
MHLMESRLADDRRISLLAEATQTRLANRRPRLEGRRRLGQWLVAVGTRIEGSPAPCPCPAGS